MSEKRERLEIEESVKACYSTWAGNYHSEYYSEKASYPPVHETLIRKLLVESKCRNLLDAGCGPATMLRGLADLDIELYGFDLTPEMVLEARRVMGSFQVPDHHIWEGSVADPLAFQSPGAKPLQYDAAICVGVLPHIPMDLDHRVVANLYQAVKPGGLVVIEARNQLFSLFSLNRYSHQFFVNELIRPEEILKEQGKSLPQEVLKELQDRFRMDLPPIRGGKEGEPGYDEVLSRTHNPFTTKKTFEDAGFHNVKTLFYHYHCLPPMFEQFAPDTFHAVSVTMENPEDWRGYFMASAFVVAGVRP